ncbi:MAG: hypothetical protein EB830_04980 [Nitrosopumilus sp. H13]|nr:MAG: hypothetical protein EB830_04980 [Nitrosopumilus sp. H13]
MHIPQILLLIDIVPIAIMYFIHEGLLLRNFDGDVHDTLETLTFFMAHIVFWVPVAHYINKFWERYRRNSKPVL